LEGKGQVLTSVLIIAISLALLLYWFRYSCSLILSTSAASEHRLEVAAANQLKFLEVQDGLDTALAASYDSLKWSLDRDYKLVTYLHRSATPTEEPVNVVEHTMLRADFQLLRFWYPVAKLFSARQAKAAIEEMAQIVGHLADSFGQRATSEAA
jgi:hypothetical protein